MAWPLMPVTEETMMSWDSSCLIISGTACRQKA